MRSWRSTAETTSAARIFLAGDTSRIRPCVSAVARDSSALASSGTVARTAWTSVPNRGPRGRLAAPGISTISIVAAAAIASSIPSFAASAAQAVAVWTRTLGRPRGGDDRRRARRATSRSRPADPRPRTCRRPSRSDRRGAGRTTKRRRDARARGSHQVTE